jgi:hypothetical protein
MTNKLHHGSQYQRHLVERELLLQKTTIINIKKQIDLLWETLEYQLDIIDTKIKRARGEN